MEKCKYCGADPHVRLVGDWKNLYVYFCSKCGKPHAYNGEARSTILGAKNIWNKRS